MWFSSDRSTMTYLITSSSACLCAGPSAHDPLTFIPHLLRGSIYSGRARAYGSPGRGFSMCRDEWGRGGGREERERDKAERDERIGGKKINRWAPVTLDTTCRENALLRQPRNVTSVTVTRIKRYFYISRVRTTGEHSVIVPNQVKYDIWNI